MSSLTMHLQPKADWNVLQETIHSKHYWQLTKASKFFMKQNCIISLLRFLMNINTSTFANNFFLFI